MRTLFRLCLLAQFSIFGLSAQAQDKLVISTIENSAVATIASDIVSVAYEKLGIDIEIVPTSGTRSLVLSSQGKVDGELMRIYQVGDKFPDLKRVQINGYSLENVVHIRQADLGQIAIEELHTKRVGHIEGVIQAARFSDGFEDVWKASSYEELYGMLAAGRLDAVISNTISGTVYLRKMTLDNITQLGPAHSVLPFYHYLYKTNERLIPKLQMVFADMYASGETDEIINAAIARMVAEPAITTSKLPPKCEQTC
ncbi:MAG: transporter substrate-binding domain-containing protein [Roseibium sp.]